MSKSASLGQIVVFTLPNPFKDACLVVPAIVTHIQQDGNVDLAVFMPASTPGSKIHFYEGVPQCEVHEVGFKGGLYTWHPIIEGNLVKP